MTLCWRVSTARCRGDYVCACTGGKNDTIITITNTKFTYIYTRQVERFIDICGSHR